MQTTEAIMAEWRKVEAEARIMADRCRADPIDAEVSYGVRLEPRTDQDAWKTFGGIRSAPPTNERAVWLRAVAKKIIPAKFQWEVMETFGGGAVLILKSVNESDDDSEFGLPAG